MKQLRRALGLLAVSHGPLFLFETVYRLAGAALLVPGFSACFAGLMRITGYRYLTAENLRSFAAHPVTLAVSLLLWALIALYFLIDIGTVLCMLDLAAQGRKCSVLFALRHALRAFRHPWGASRLLLLAYLPVLGVFLHLGTMAALVFTVRIPVPVLDFILKHPLYIFLSALAFTLLGGWMMRWLYVPIFHLSGVAGFREARRKSVLLARKYWFQNLACVFLVQCALMLFYGLAALAGILLLRVVSASLARSFLTSHVLTFLVSALLAVSILSIPATYAMIYALLERQTESLGQSMTHITAEEGPVTSRARRLRRVLGALAILGALAGCILIIYRYQRRRYNLDIEYLRTMEVTAHRGDSAHSPENTMAAFQTAWNNGADWIELDVRQSSDGVIYCMHDSTFTRVTGVKKQSWELSWPEISQLDAGSHFSGAFAGERLPLLEEAIDFAAQSGVRLNIELKPTAHDSDLEQATADIIRQKGFEDQCVVTCQRYLSLEKLKEYAPELTTVYVMPMVYGNLDQLTAADHFSVSYHFINRDMVSRLHQKGKQVYAWTVDRADIMQRMIDLGVDNIITNNVALGKACVSAAAASDIVQTLVEEFVEDTDAH